jgi:hypothetical protein
VIKVCSGAVLLNFEFMSYLNEKKVTEFVGKKLKRSGAQKQMQNGVFYV